MLLHHGRLYARGGEAFPTTQAGEVCSRALSRNCDALGIAESSRYATGRRSPATCDINQSVDAEGIAEGSRVVDLLERALRRRRRRSRFVDRHRSGGRLRRRAGYRLRCLPHPPFAQPRHGTSNRSCKPRNCKAEELTNGYEKNSFTLSSTPRSWTSSPSDAASCSKICRCSSLSEFGIRTLTCT